MTDKDALFAPLPATDEALAAAVAERLGQVLPPECVPGVAANARLLQHHADLLRGGAM